MELEKNQLIDAIRAAESLQELKRLVGPSANEMQNAKNRIARLDDISTACQWENVYPGAKALQAREQYQRIAQEQGKFEALYC